MGPVYGTRPLNEPAVTPPWPRMNQSDVQRYTRVFSKVDTDRDGKITGEQARALFLSWQQPRSVLERSHWFCSLVVVDVCSRQHLAYA